MGETIASSNAMRSIINDLKSYLMSTINIIDFDVVSAVMNEFADIVEKYCNKDSSLFYESCRLLFIASDSDEHQKLQHETEFTKINIAVQDMTRRCLVFSDWSIRNSEISHQIFKRKPNIVHFSAHGKKVDYEFNRNAEALGVDYRDKGGLFVKNEFAQTILAPIDAFEEMFLMAVKEFNVFMVVFNACYTHELARAISKHIPYAIGYNTELSDAVAIAFTEGLYTAISRNKCIEEAFDYAINLIKMKNLKGGEQYVLFKR